MKHFFVKTVIFCALSVTPLHATKLNNAAECSVYMNFFNQKYGLQLIDKGYTHNTIMEDDLYKRSASYQVMFIVAASLHENWNVQSYDNFLDAFLDSEIMDIVGEYEKQHKGLSVKPVSNLMTLATSPDCRFALDDYILHSDVKSRLLDRFDLVAPYIEKARGFWSG